MQYIKDKGFIIKRSNIGECDRYITIFSQNFGKMDFLARGVRKITSKRSSKLELLSCISFDAVKKKNAVLTDISMISSCSDYSYESAKSVFLICELIDAFMPHNERHQEIYDLLTKTVHSVREGLFNSPVFELNLLKILGFWNEEYSFKNDLHRKSYIESIIERKIKTPLFFEA